MLFKQKAKGKANMYQKIYDVVEKNGRAKTGIVLNGKYAGLKYLAEEDCFFIRIIKQEKKQPKIF